MCQDALNKAFTFFGGVPLRMVYDNLKRSLIRFLSIRNVSCASFFNSSQSLLCESVVCTPTAGWKKSQVENQVSNVREWLLTPCARFADFNELNVWLEKRCEELSGRKHPSQKTRTIAECFNDEQSLLRPIIAV